MPSPSKRKSDYEVLLEVIKLLPPHVAFEIWDTKKTAEFLHIGREEVYHLVDERGLRVIDLNGQGHHFLAGEVFSWVLQNLRAVS